MHLHDNFNGGGEACYFGAVCEGHEDKFPELEVVRKIRRDGILGSCRRSLPDF